MKISRALLAGALVLSSYLPAGASGESDRAAIERLLDRRAEAVLSGDAEAFMSTVGDPDSAFGRKQARLFRHLRSVPLASYDLDADWEAYGDLARPSDRGRYPGAEEVIIPLTVARYRIRGYDERPVREDMFFTFVKRGDDWLIEGDSDLDDIGFLSARSLWDFSPLDVVENGRAVAILPASQPRSSGETIVAQATSAIERVERYWPTGWSGKVPILVPDDPGVLARIIQATYPVGNYVAFSFWTGEEGEDPGARIIVNPDGFAAADAVRRLTILAHEITHVATLPSSGPFMPRFLDEGLAQYVQYEGGEAEIGVADASSDGTLPEDHEFFRDDAAAVLDAYRESLSAAGFIAERWGYPRLTRLYERLGRRGNVPGIASFHLDKALRATLKVGLQHLEDLWASSIGA